MAKPKAPKKSGSPKKRKKTPRGNGKAKAKATSTIVPQSDQPSVTEACEKVNGLLAAGMNLRQQYLQQEAIALGQIQAATQERDALLKMVCKKLSIPEDWILNTDTMSFRPPGMNPAALQQPPPQSPPEPPKAPETPAEGQ